MERHAASPGVQEMGAGLLRAVAANGAAEKAAVAAEGGLVAALAALQRHVGNAAVAEQCLEALWALSGLPENRAAILRGGGAAAAAAAMAAHAGAAGVQARGVGALWGMLARGGESVGEPAGPEEAALAKAALVAAMAAHPEETQVQTYAAAALRSIA